MKIDEKAFAAICEDEDSPYRGYPFLRRAVEAYEAAKLTYQPKIKTQEFKATSDWTKPHGFIQCETQITHQPDEERIAYHERSFDEMKDIFLLESLRCAGLNICEPALWMGICRSAMKRLSNLCLPKRESGDESYATVDEL
jgi:hypothetical protein